MTLALRSPQLIESLVSVDNAPLDAALLSDFAKYVQGMRKIEESEVTKQAEADKILQDYAEASHKRIIPSLSSVLAHSGSLLQFDNFSSATSTVPRTRKYRSSKSR
jgi:hypothetical protein